MISGSNEQLQQQLEYTLLKPDCQAEMKVIDTLTQEDFQRLLEQYNKCIAARGDYFEGD